MKITLAEDLKINPFVPNALFFYPLKTSENRRVFGCFQGVEKGCLGNEWVNSVFSICNVSILDPFSKIFLNSKNNSLAQQAILDQCQ